MRLHGDRHWLRGTRLAPALACVLLLASASSASALTRYASPTGAASGVCAVGIPCELEYAVETAAGAGDEVIVTSGTYSITSTIVVDSSTTLRGGGGPRPRLVGSAALAGAPVTIQGGASIDNLRIESQNASPALDLSGVGTQLELYSNAGTAARLRGSSSLTTAIVSTSAAGASALALTDGLLTGATVRHATIVATGAGSTALDASGLNLLGIGAPSVVSSIVNGTTTDVAGGLLNAVNLNYSAYRFASSNGAAADDGTNVNAAALLVNPAGGDFQQQSASLTFNAGSNPDGAAIDLAGNPRSIAGAPDIGALELPIPPDATTGSASAVTGTTATIGGTVDPRASATDFQFKWGTTNPPSTAGPVHSLPATSAGGSYSDNITGLKPGTTYYYRVVATNPWGTTAGTVASFATPSVAPVATTDAPNSITETSARLKAKVNPGGALTSIEFQWGSDASYGNVAGSQSIGAGTADIKPTTDLSGLLPNATYHYRVVATNSNGTVYGADRTFTTCVAAPTATTRAATDIQAHSATANADLNPGGGEATVHFHYGQTTAYDSETATVDVAATRNPVSIGIPLTGLAPGTEYHYQAVVENEADIVYGSDVVFTTAAAQPDVVTGIATSMTHDSADLAATVGTGGADTRYEFEYGKTRDYGMKTVAGSVAAVKTSDQVTAKLTALEPGSEYHYRVVANNIAGTTVGSDMTFTTRAAPTTEPAGAGPAGSGVRTADGLPAPDPAPPVGESANAAPSSGTVRVRVPGSSEYVELTEGAGIPIGSIVDASHGEVVITSASDNRGGTQTAAFTGSEFKVVQKKAAKPITDLVLTGGNLSECTPRMLTKIGEVEAAGRRKWSRRRLWGNGHGRFRTRGRHGTATVRGTWWLTEDRCDGTLVRVKRGLVAVRDLAGHKTVLVPAGDEYFARSLVSRKARAKKTRVKRGR